MDCISGFLDGFLNNIFCYVFNDVEELFQRNVGPTKGVKAYSHLGHCQRLSPLQVSDTPRAGFEPTYQLKSKNEFSI